jgi:hypothetical protein
MLLVALAALALPIGASYWTWQDAKRRRMSTRWAIAVGLALIIFLPVYLLVRKPVRCDSCGKEIPADFALCQECDQVPDQEGEGRPGRIFG